MIHHKSFPLYIRFYYKKSINTHFEIKKGKKLEQKKTIWFYLFLLTRVCTIKYFNCEIRRSWCWFRSNFFAIGIYNIFAPNSYSQKEHVEN